MAYDPSTSPLYELLQSAPSYQLRKGQIVHALDDRTKFNLIVSGYIKRYLITNEGVNSIQVIYGPNQVFPLPPVLKSIFEMDVYRGPETYYYESITDIVVHSIALDDLQTAIETNPDIYKDLLYIAGSRLNSYIYRLEDTSLGSSTWRIAHQLLYLADQFGEPSEQGIKIMVPLTHQTLSEILNLSRETVSRTIIKLRDNKLIIAGRFITIPDIEKLKQVYRSS